MIIGLGLLMSFGQILLTHGMADGELGLSVDDIVFSYYGNREGSRLESKLQGSMKLMADEQTRASIIKWVRKGSPRDEWDAGVAQLVGAHCTRCHGVIPGIPDYTNYEGIKTVAQIDEGTTVPTLARVLTSTCSGSPSSSSSCAGSSLSPRASPPPSGSW